MAYARKVDWERRYPEGEAVINQSQQIRDDGPEFSSGPMPAAFAACLFLGVGLLIFAIAAFFW